MEVNTSLNDCELQKRTELKNSCKNVGSKLKNIFNQVHFKKL